MGKEEQLMEYIIQDIVDMFSSDQNMEYEEAMNQFYNSEVFEKLQDKETGLYRKVQNMCMIFLRMRSILDILSKAKYKKV